MDNLFIIAFAVLVFAIISGVLYWKKSNNLNDSDMQLAILVAFLMKEIVESLDNIEYSDKLSNVIEYVIKAIQTAQKYEDAETLKLKKEVIKLEVLELCKENDIEVDEDFVQAIELAIDFAIDNNYIK